MGAGIQRTPREVARHPVAGAANLADPWGVQYPDGAVYASDTLNGRWKLPAAIPR
jgi:hypothetical protein